MTIQTKTLMLLFLFVSPSLFANDAEPLKPLFSNIPPIIEGILDDPVWQQAPYETGFKTYYPDYGADVSEETTVWYAYDQDNLYFAFRCYDSEPDKIKTSVTARDQISPDDWVCLNLDTFNDQQTLTLFYINPMGIQMDSRATATEEDLSIDMVWYSEGKIDDLGYCVEIKIPFKSIRFSHTEPVEMGIIFERHISRKSEAGTLPPLDPQQGPNFLTQTRTLLYENVKHFNLTEILPAITYSHNRTAEEGRLAIQDERGDFSLTGKYGITSHLVLDGTFNPDFSQVEADAGQVDFNQRYALYYPEKRPFFLEGRENFFFGGSSEGDPLGAVVHTRTIIDPLLGVKLNGKLGAKNTIATIYALDELPTEDNLGDHAHFTILRYKRALNQDGFFGSFLTSRDLDKSANRLAGTDGLIRLNNASYLGFHGFYSATDSSQRKNKTGYAWGTNYYYNTRDWTINMRVHDLSESFNTEIGYVTRTGITRYRLGVIRMLYPDSQIIKRIDPLLNNQFIKDKESDLWENSNAFYLTFVLPRSSAIRVGYAFAREIYLGEKFSTSNFSAIGNSQLTKQVFLSFNYKFGEKIRYSSSPYQGWGHDATASIIYQPSDRYLSSLSLTMSDFYNQDTDAKEFDYTILWLKNTYQLNKYLFFRVILEYNSFYEQLKTDFLMSFTYIPGSVIFFGYGSFYEKIRWEKNQYENSDRFLETRRGLFFKASYLWRI